MTNIKPFQMILMAVFGVLAIIGLFLFANFKGFTGGVQSVGTVVIWGTFPQEAFDSGLDDVQLSHPEYSGISYVEKQADTFDADLANAIASGKGPDLVVISQEQLLTEEPKLSLIPYSSISARTFKNTYLPITELYLTSTGTYGIPFVIDPLVLYYNRPVIASAGLANPPSTWEAVSGLAPTVTKQTAAQTITRSLVAFGTYDNVENARGILSLLFLQAGTFVSAESNGEWRGVLNQGSSSTYGSSSTEGALDFYTEFANPAKTIYSWNRSLPEDRQAFLVGDLALYFGFASENARLRAANPNLDFDMAPVPQPGTSATRTTFGLAYAFAVPKGSVNAKGAFSTAIALTSKGNLPSLAHALGVAPAVRALLSPMKDDIYEPVYFPEAIIARGWLSPAPQKTDAVFGAMIQSVLSGRQNVHDALETANQALTAALK